MLSQPKPAVPQHAAKVFQHYWQHLKGKFSLNSAFEKADRLLEQKHTGSQLHYFAPLALEANLCWHLPEEIFLFHNKSEEPPKKSKTTRNAYLGLEITIHVKNISIHLVTQSL
jgi:hypothetical protein